MSKDCPVIEGIRVCGDVKYFATFIKNAKDILDELNITAIYDAYFTSLDEILPLENAIIYKMPITSWCEVLKPRTVDNVIVRKLPLLETTYFDLHRCYMKKADAILLNYHGKLVGIYNKASNVFIITDDIIYISPPGFGARLLKYAFENRTPSSKTYGIFDILDKLPLTTTIMPKFKVACSKGIAESDGERVYLKCRIEREITKVLDTSEGIILKLKKPMKMRGTITFAWDGFTTKVIESNVRINGIRHPNTAYDNVCFGDEIMPEYDNAADVCENLKTLCEFAERVLSVPNIGSPLDEEFGYYLMDHEELIEKTISFY